VGAPDLYECYAILGASPEGGRAEAKRRLRLLQKLYHPDRLANDPTVAAEATRNLARVHDAYDTLVKAGFPRLAPPPQPATALAPDARPPMSTWAPPPRAETPGTSVAPSRHLAFRVAAILAVGAGIAFIYVRMRDATVIVDGSSLRDAPDDGASYRQSTPTEALESFIRAIRNRRFDVLVRLPPAARRTGEEDARRVVDGPGGNDLRRRVGLLEVSLDNLIVVDGDRAWLGFGDGNTVSLVRERGAWKIDELK